MSQPRAMRADPVHAVHALHAVHATRRIDWRLPGLLACALASACAAPPAADVDGADPETGQASLENRSTGEGRRCGDLRAGRAAVLAHDRLFSLLSQRVGLRGFAALLDRDVVFETPGLPILFGRDAVLAHLREVDPDGTARLSWTPSRIDASIDGAFGYAFGWTETRQRAADGSETVATGKNIAVWRRDGGLWRVIAYMEAPTAAAGLDAPAGFGLFPDGTRRCAERIGAEQALDEVLDADADFAARSVETGPGPSFAEFVAPDGALRPGNGWAIGPAEIAALFGLPDPTEVLDWAPTAGAAARSGDLGFTVGVASDTITAPEGETVFWSKYLTVWEKHPDDRWLFVVDGGSGAPPP